ncbi:IS3 family transposase [Spirosoma foliorum]|uniref:IS3 family transposase n=1 Tax=Spirosoma foliorum TaxID=2710596 RepID=A0A7G5GZL3_9BACT|nr:IS3 family transposase [Spirosoma foliorum]
MHFATRVAARLALVEYIESWYNRRRKHSTLRHRTPSQQETYFFTTAMAA